MKWIDTLDGLNDKFDMARLPVRQRWFLRPITWVGSYPDVWARRLKINRQHVQGLKPPYLLLCTHMAFMDFKVTTAAIFPHRANYVVAIDGFIGREWLLRNAGGICKRKFVNDVTLVRHIKRVIDNGDVLALYPEARYSQVGTTAVLPDSLGKLVRILGVPVVMLNMHGNYLNSPCWNLRKRGVPLAADFTQILTADESKKLTADVVNQRIRDAFVYDEYRWQLENNIKIDKPFLAEGLHKVLYQCPDCKTEYRMESGGRRLWCASCGHAWQMTNLGQLQPEPGSVGFSHIPDWYEFQRQEVRRQIEAGTYHLDVGVEVDSLPNARGYIPLGKGRLTHDLDGFHLSGDFRTGPFTLHKTPKSMYSCHVEYSYFGHGDCISFSTRDDTYYIYPKSEAFSVTKIALATEELYAYAVKQDQTRSDQAVPPLSSQLPDQAVPQILEPLLGVTAES